MDDETILHTLYTNFSWIDVDTKVYLVPNVSKSFSKISREKKSREMGIKFMSF